MVRRAYAVVGLTVALVLLALLASAPTVRPFLGGTRAPHRLPAAQPPAFPHVRSPSRPTTLPHGVVVAITVALALYMLGLLVLLILSRFGRRSDDDDLRRPAEQDPDGSQWHTLLAAELGIAATEQLVEIAVGTPRNAIVACWVRLQEATGRAGLPAVPSETPREFAARAMRLLGLETTAMGVLAELYREARFSEHPLGEEHRSQAVAALTVLVAQLAVPATTP